MEAAQSVAQGRCGNALKNIYLKKKMKRLLYLLLIPVLMFVPAHAQENIEDGDVYVSDDADTICVDSLPDEWQSLPWPQSVQESLTSLLDAPMFRTSQVGIMVYDLDADSAIFRHNERQRLRPASTMKLVTAIAAIDKLGGGYQFKTELCYTGSVADGVLRGDVYCVGGFDPRFNSDDLRAFVESIHKMGVDTIRGNLYADKTIQDSTDHEVVFAQSEVPVITGDILNSLRTTGKTLCVVGDGYTLQVSGKDVRNTTGELNTSLELQQVEQGLEFVVNDGKTVPCSARIDLDKSDYSRLYLYNETTGKWQYLNSYKDGVITLDTAGRYLLTNENLRFANINWSFFIAGGAVLVVIAVAYIAFKKRYWFW